MLMKRMFINIFVSFSLLFALGRGESKNDPLVVYSNGNSEIIVKNLVTRKTVKSFTIQIEDPIAGIAVDYKNDHIFFADKKNIYKIYLIDGTGRHTVSGRGELFTNKKADHFEIFFYNLELKGQWGGYYDLCALFYDDASTDLYAIAYLEGKYSRVIRFNFREGWSQLDPKHYGAYKYEYPFLYNGMLYVSNGGHIYNTSLAMLNTSKALDVRVNDERIDVSTFSIDKRTSRLFYTEVNSIRVLKGDISKTPTLWNNTRILLANSRVTKGVQALGVCGKYVVWSSAVWRKLYVGVLNDEGTFLSIRNVAVLDNTAYDLDFNFDNVVIIDRTEL